MSIERTVSPGFLADRAAATVKEAGALAGAGAGPGRDREAARAADRAVAAVETAGETRAFQAAANAAGVDRADLRRDVLAGRFEEAGRKLDAVAGAAAAKADVLNGARVSNNEPPRSAAGAGLGDDRDYAAERLRGLDRASHKRGGFTSAHAPVGGPGHGIPYASVPKVIRDAADHVRQEAVARQQRGAQYYADKIAGAPEAPARAQTETRAARLRAG